MPSQKIDAGGDEKLTSVWVQEAGGGGGGGGARGGTGPPPSFLDWGGTGSTKKWYQHLHESSKIMLSEVHQLLHITLTIPELRLPLQNEHFLPCIDTMTQSFFNDAIIMLLYYTDLHAIPI